MTGAVAMVAVRVGRAPWLRQDQGTIEPITCLALLMVPMDISDELVTELLLNLR